MADAAILVVCGDATRRGGFVRALSTAGWTNILAASSAAEAAGCLGRASCACAIVDNELTDIPGLKAVPILQGFCPQLRTVFCVPVNTRELEAQVRALDVLYYHIGSADQLELVAAVRDAVGAPTPAAPGARPRVLVVDDDAGYQESVRAMLESAGYEVSSAYSEREALDAARRERPDVILLDIIMESTTDGFVFCHEARRDPLLKHTPILGASAIERRMDLSSPPGDERDLFPVDGYLRKPLAREELLSELSRLLPGTCDEHERPQPPRESGGRTSPAARGGR
jgi:CheY-like chemotaxis protein